MRILFVGDIVGRSGRAAVLERLPALIAQWRLDFVAVNGENAAGGFGITEAIYQELIDAGADAITGGNHSWDQKEALVFIERAPKLLRPVNYPAGTPGRGVALIEAKNGARVLIVNAMGRFCDGRASLVAGTHTHAPTADHQILPYGTAFVSDLGMTGDYNSVIGMDKDEPLTRFLRKIAGARFEPAMGEATLCALAVETDDSTGLARRVGAVRLGGRLEQARPPFWE